MEIKKALKTNMQELSLNSKPICEKCGTPKYAEVEMFGTVHIMPCLCKCESEARQKREQQRLNEEKQYRLERLFDNSLMDENFKQCTFENWKHSKQNEKLYRLVKAYVEKWDKVKKENIGLMLHGNPGNGKTFAVFCIANYLLEKYIPVVAISSIGIINRIYDSYKRFGDEGEASIINQLKSASLLIVDDLGAEYKTAKSRQLLYSIIDNRYRDNKPLLVTTNLSMDQLKEKLTGDDEISRTYDRLIEMCTPFKVEGESLRKRKAKDKIKTLTELLGG